MPSFITSGRTEIRTYPNPCSRAIEIYVTRGTTYPVDMEWEDVEHTEGMQRPPTFTLDYEACQVLMDSLYGSGFRPSQGASSAGQREALESHLKDMRTLAFTTLEIEKP